MEPKLTRWNKIQLQLLAAPEKYCYCQSFWAAITSNCSKVWKSKSSLNNERRLVLGQMFDPLTHESGDQAMAVS